MDKINWSNFSLIPRPIETRVTQPSKKSALFLNTLVLENSSPQQLETGSLVTVHQTHCTIACSVYVM